MSLVTTPLAQQVIGCAIQVHRTLGPGLFESAYEECLCLELSQAGLEIERQVPLSLVYGGVRVDCVYRADLIVNDELLIEIKSIDRLLPIHHQQVLTYLRLVDVKQALLINFNVPLLVNGLKSFLQKAKHEDCEASDEHGEEQRTSG